MSKKLIIESKKVAIPALGAVLSGLGIKVNLVELAKSINSHEICERFPNSRLRLKLFVKNNMIQFRLTSPITIDLIRERVENNKITISSLKEISEIKKMDFPTNLTNSIVSCLKATAKSAHIEIID